MTRAELLGRISSKELTEWMQFYQREPFGADASFLGHAITSAVVANTNRGKKGKSAEVEDFMPKFEKQKQGTVEDAINFARVITAAMSKGKK